MPFSIEEPFAIEIYAKGINIGNQLARIHIAFLCESASFTDVNTALSTNVKF